MSDSVATAIPLSLLFAVFAAIMYAVNAALPGADEAALKEEGTPSAKRALRLLEHFENGFGEMRLAYCLQLLLSFCFVRTLFDVDDLLLAVLFSAAAFLLTAIIPGAIAMRYPSGILKALPLPASFVLALSSVVTLPVYWIGRALLSPFRLHPGIAEERITEEDIREMVDIGEESGAIEADEKEMIENVFEFNNLTAEDCMIHRKDITALDIDTSPDEILETIRESGLSRYPVYENTIDNIIGILTARDFLLDRCKRNPSPVRALLRPAHFVPESVRADTLFSQMQKRKTHISIVIDEYGGTSGLVTLEDLLEEIVGNIYDEFDPKEEQDITILPDGRWRVSGSTDLETLSEAIGVEIPENDAYDTLGGLVFAMLSEIPADGEHPTVECLGLVISVTEIADRRVEWAIIEKTDRDNGTDNENDNE